MLNISKEKGTRFENEFMLAAKTAGLFIQQMPVRVGFDFLLGSNGSLEAIETKCVANNHLRLKHFTPIEIRVADEMTARGENYFVVFPLYSAFGKITWAEIRTDLFENGGVVLNSPFHEKIFPMNQEV